MTQPIGGSSIAQPQTVEHILTRYAMPLQISRDRIIADLRNAPATAVLTEYFQAGKGFRALLAFVGASAIGIEPSTIIPLTAALELLHGASLIHDDIADEAAERRTLSALHVQIGIGPALILGDYLILRAFMVLQELQKVYGLEKTCEASRALNSYAQACCRGEFHDLLPTGAGNPEDVYLTIVQGKTASQFAAAVTLPAIIGGAPSRDIEALQTYGLKVGTAFQIQDDVLDLIGDSSVLGKPIGNGLVNARLLLPLIYLEQYGSPTARREYSRMQHTESATLVHLANLLKEEGILDRIRLTQDRYLSTGLQALDQLRPSDDRDALSVLATYAVRRHA